MRRSKQVGVVALAVTAMLGLATPATARAQEHPTPRAEGVTTLGDEVRLVVDLHGASVDELGAATVDGTTVTEVFGTDQAVVTVEPGDLGEVADQLEAAGAPVVEVDPRVEATAQPTDAWWPEQSRGFSLVGVPGAWDVTTGSDTVIAVIDTGVSPVSELAGRLLPGRDFVVKDEDGSNDYDAADLNGHGTQAATVAAGAANNGVAGAGVCWTCRVLPVRVLDSNGSGLASDVAAGINWAVDQGADVVSLSLGAPSPSYLMGQAVAAARAAGVVVVAAAGNGYAQGQTISYPGAHPSAIAVAAVDAGGQYFYYSNRGDWVDVAAPGLNISQNLAGQAAWFNGTSSATPVVAGSAALALAADPARSAEEVVALITSSGPVYPGIGGPLLDARRVAVPPGTPDFGPLAPARLLDTRGLPTVDGHHAWWGRVPAGGTVELPVSGRAGVPGWADSVVLNVTATETAAAGFVTVYPCGAARPNASNLNFEAGQTVPNLVVSKIGSGKVCLFAAASTQLVVDVAAYLPAGATFGSTSPARLLDTRGFPTADGQVPWWGYVAGGQTVELPVAGRAGVPADAGSVVLNVTAVHGQANGYVTAFPCGSSVPLASNLNFVPGQTVANLIVSEVGAGGKVCLYAAGTTHLLADVAAWFPPGADFAAGVPARLLDTRPYPTVDGAFSGGGSLPAGGEIELQVLDRADVPSTATAVVLNVTAANPQAEGFVTVWPCGSRPLASNLNFVPGQTVPNLVMAEVAADGTVCLYTAGATELVADVAGWFGAS
ncbi:MAG: S8 family serine peptidase [Acidimicrobiia bacterium]|nr:S8 family serine peptidase [Acidimicrobiia bacterium]